MRQMVSTPFSISPALLLALALGLLGLFWIGFDQGQTLAMVQGDNAYTINLIHELVHDARHAAGFPCH